MKGLFIAIEGTDGSGKGTQFAILKSRLESEGYEVVAFDFPRYDESSSYFVKEYLNGRYGGLSDVNPYVSSLFYALDRYHVASKIRQSLEEGKIVLANRFTGSNMAHQGAKIQDHNKRLEYFSWITDLESKLLDIPQPDINIVLKIPSIMAQQLVDKKEQRSYTDEKRDIHEADNEYMDRSVCVYDELCQKFPDKFISIECVVQQDLLSIDVVSDTLWEKIFVWLNENKTHIRKKS